MQCKRAMRSLLMACTVAVTGVVAACSGDGSDLTGPSATGPSSTPSAPPPAQPAVVTSTDPFMCEAITFDDLDPSGLVENGFIGAAADLHGYSIPDDYPIEIFDFTVNLTLARGDGDGAANPNPVLFNTGRMDRIWEEDIQYNPVADPAAGTGFAECNTAVNGPRDFGGAYGQNPAKNPATLGSYLGPGGFRDCGGFQGPDRVSDPSGLVVIVEDENGIENDGNDSQGGEFTLEMFPNGRYFFNSIDFLDNGDLTETENEVVVNGVQVVAMSSLVGNGTVERVEASPKVVIENGSIMSILTGSGAIDNIEICKCAGVLGDFVWNDLNGNGIQDLPDEPGIEGVKLTLTKDGDPNFVLTATTDADGAYLFTELCPGTYTITYDPNTVPEGFVPTDTNAGPPDVDSNPNPDTTPEFTELDFEDLTYDFGFVLDCQECDGGLIRIDLLYDGPDATITVDGDVVFEENGMTSKFVANGEEFVLVVAPGKDKMKSDIKLKVNGQETKIHVSCSKPIGPGLVFGDYTVTFAVSRLGGVVCPLPPQPDCAECKGGVTELTFEFTGADGSLVEIIDENVTIFSEILNNGDQRTINGSKDDGKFVKNDLIVKVNGQQNATIHVSCSQPIGPGAVFGDLTIVEVFSRDFPGIPVCPVPPPPDCVECKGGVIELTFEFTGADGSLVEIIDENVTIFSEILNNGDQRTINGSKDDGKFVKNDLIVKVNGQQNATIHVSCSQPIGPNAVFGDLTIIEVFSKDFPNIPVCPVPPPPDCVECKGGVIEMTLLYSGPGATIMVEGEVVFEENLSTSKFVADGEEFTLIAQPGKDKMKSDIKLKINGQETKIHTSCSQPIGPGAVFGPYTVVQVFSKDFPSIEVCPVPPPPPPGEGDLCLTIGKPKMLKLEYTGGSCALESNTQGDKSKCSDEGALTNPASFKAGDKDKGTESGADRFGSATVLQGGTWIVDATLDGETKLKSATKVHVCSDAACTDRLQFVEIHTSCSAPLLLNETFGSLKLIGYMSETGGTAGDI